MHVVQSLKLIAGIIFFVMYEEKICYYRTNLFLLLKLVIFLSLSFSEKLHNQIICVSDEKL